jgi:hypothetical protein
MKVAALSGGLQPGLSDSLGRAFFSGVSRFSA